MNGRELMEQLKKFPTENELVIVDGDTNELFVVKDIYNGFGGTVVVLETNGTV